MKNIPLIDDIENAFYHYSDFSFNSPDIQKISENRQNNINGLLGLYFSTTNSPWCKIFGQNCYKINTPKHFNKKILSFEEFKKITSSDIFGFSNIEEINYFQNLRIDFLSKNIDYILILELDNTCAMGVFINLDIELKLM